MDTQHFPVATLTPHNKFHAHIYPDIPQGVEIPPKEHAKLIDSSLKILSNEKLKKTLDILSMSMSNRNIGEQL